MGGRWSAVGLVPKARSQGWEENLAETRQIGASRDAGRDLGAGISQFLSSSRRTTKDMLIIYQKMSKKSASSGVDSRKSADTSSDSGREQAGYDP